jgi:hypothetical protein
VLSYGSIALVIYGYFSRQNAAYMAYMLLAFYLCVFPSGKWLPEHPIVQALPFFPSDGHLLADAAAMTAVTGVVLKMFKPCTFLAWALLLTHFLPEKCGFAVPSSARLLSDVVQALHYVALIDVPVIIVYIVASPRLSFLAPVKISKTWRLLQVSYQPLKPPLLRLIPAIYSLHTGLFRPQLRPPHLHRLHARSHPPAAHHPPRTRWRLQVGYSRQIQLQRIFPRIC